MKLELTQGCIAGWLGANGIAESFDPKRHLKSLKGQS